MVYRTDLDHPNSVHNTLTNQDMSVQFPNTMHNGQGPQFSLNGYYDK